MSVIKYPAEIRLELIAQELQEGRHYVLQEKELREIAIEVHDMRFKLSEAERERDKENKNSWAWFAIALLLAASLVGTYLTHALTWLFSNA